MSRCAYHAYLYTSNFTIYSISRNNFVDKPACQVGIDIIICKQYKASFGNILLHDTVLLYTEEFL